MTKLITPAGLEADVAADAPIAGTGRKVKARVLRSCTHGHADDVVSLAPDVAKQAEAAGEVDTAKAAVAYVEGLARKAIEG
jgi:hypothetical protein